MAIVGIGIDLVEVPRIQHLLDKHGERFIARTFTDAEAAYCRASARPAIHFAARFAAKEAAAKALGSGIADGISWVEIEVCRTEQGKPELQLHGTAAANAASLGVSHCHLSLSHTSDHAIAQVILESRDK